MKKLSVTYVAPEKVKASEIISSSPIYTVPQDTLGRGTGMSIEDYVKAQIAHPSIISVMLAAVKAPSTAVSIDTDDITALYFAQVGDAVAAEGFTFAIADVTPAAEA